MYFWNDVKAEHLIRIRLDVLLYLYKHKQLKFTEECALKEYFSSVIYEDTLQSSWETTHGLKIFLHQNKHVDSISQ